MPNKNRSTKEMETSKLLLCVLLGGLALVTLCAILFSFIYADANPLVVLIQCICKLSSIAVGFYFYKAKCENMQKYKNKDKIGEITDEVKVYE